jgi:uncharacterized membrane protein YbhN (UPF0104 family)
MAKVFKAVLGALLFGAFAARLGYSALADALVSVGPWFVVVALFDVAGMVCDASAIRELAHRRTSLGNAFVAQASGYMVNRLTPGSTLGEPVKIARLTRSAPRDVAVSAIVLYNVATFGVGVVVIAIGTPLALYAHRLAPTLELAVGIACGVLVVGLGVLLALVRRGPVAGAIRGVRRLRLISPERAGRWHDRTRAIDANLATFGDAPSRRGVLLVFASRGLEQLGTLTLLHALGAPLSGGLGIAVISLGILITWISNVMPFGLGVADGGHYTLFALFGAPATLGLAFAMLERARAAILGLVGAATCGLALSQRRDRSMTASRMSVGPRTADTHGGSMAMALE